METKTSEKIKELRIKKGLSQRELAESCGISYSNLNRIENGKGEASIETLLKLTKVLGGGLIGNKLAYIKNDEVELINTLIQHVVTYYVPENLELKERVENAKSILETYKVPVVQTLLGECPGLYDDIKGLVVDVIKNRLNHYIKEDK